VQGSQTETVSQAGKLPPRASSQTVCANREQTPSSAARLRTLQRHPTDDTNTTALHHFEKP